MKTLAPLLVLAMTIPTGSAANSPDSRFYEMRVYYAAPGKLDALNARFRNHTCRLFEKHGMQNIGYWMPVENPDNRLIYVLAYPNREARETAWKNFMADPAWQKVRKESEADGR
ncbi:MAG TPA: NIPSNAP family protein, partial [Methylomirabilota bacterium]|nr:NIPSNAP family protein [Methylomirabilota bacterium]